MATPFSTPGFPNAPKPTPSTTVLANRAALRAPIHNPFDKFTKPEFDSWIGDITGALKRALGREEAPVLATPAQSSEDFHSADVSAYGDVDDSFAEIKARRAAKGKERAREEDLSDYEAQGSPEVVVISSDEEEGSGGENAAEEVTEGEVGSEEEEASDQEEGYHDSEDEYDASNDEGGPSTVPRVGRAAESEEVAEEEEDEDEEGEGEGEVIEVEDDDNVSYEGPEDIDEDEEEEDDEDEPASVPPRTQPRVVYELNDDDEEDELEDDSGKARTTTALAHFSHFMHLRGTACRRGGSSC